MIVGNSAGWPVESPVSTPLSVPGEVEPSSSLAPVTVLIPSLVLVVGSMPSELLLVTVVVPHAS